MTEEAKEFISEIETMTSKVDQFVTESSDLSTEFEDEASNEFPSEFSLIMTSSRFKSQIAEMKSNVEALKIQEFKDKLSALKEKLTP